MNQKFPPYRQDNLLPLNHWQGRLGSLMVSSLMITTWVSLVGRAIAQEYPGCFFRNRSGEVIELREVCGYTEPEPLPETTTAVSSEAGFYQAKIIRRDGGIPVIEVLFNNQQSFEMLVDTGASSTVITPIMAEFLGVVPSGTGKADTPSQKGVEFDIGLIQSINVGGAVKANVPVAIAPALSFGLLGQDFFGQYDVTIKETVIEFRERT